MNSTLPGSLEHITADTRSTGQGERRQSHRAAETRSFDQHIAAFFPYPRGNAETLIATPGGATERRLSATTPASSLQRRRQARDS